jgi:excisionase family DNA binding protein
VETYMTIEELAAYLKMAEKTIRKWMFNRAVLFHKIIKAVRFRLSEIYNIIIQIIIFYICK